MSKNWAADIHDMHTKYGVAEWVKANPDKLEQLLHFRIAFLKEEFDETFKAVGERDPEEIVDGLIDLCVVAIGTLDSFGVDAERAWDEVLKANMSKEVGIKPERSNPLGLPDLIKPEGWTAPSHEGNHGILTDTLKGG
jgi:NTP pyrophosphatase (non-canonical NTP hydrolase)